jgi:hypothetical protein
MSAGATLSGRSVVAHTPGGQNTGAVTFTVTP